MSSSKETIRGFDAIIRCLQEEGVDLIFGYPGAAIIDLLDALLKSPIRHVRARHEVGGRPKRRGW